MTVTDIIAGDQIASEGDRYIARISGRVLKANRVTLEIEGDYFGNPLQYKIRRDDLRGRVRVLRDGIIHTLDS